MLVTTVTTEVADSSIIALDFRDSDPEMIPAPAFSADVRFDGCVHFYRHYIGDSESDYIHICDIDEMILIMTEIRDKAKAHFGEEWPL